MGSDPRIAKIPLAQIFVAMPVNTAIKKIAIILLAREGEMEKEGERGKYNCISYIGCNIDIHFKIYESHVLYFLT
jgi:hypothetical protein